MIAIHVKAASGGFGGIYNGWRLGPTIFEHLLQQRDPICQHSHVGSGDRSPALVIVLNNTLCARPLALNALLIP